MTTTQDIKYVEVPEAEVPAYLVWVVPDRNQGQTVEIAYSTGRPVGLANKAGTPINYDADRGDPWQRVTDRSEPIGKQVTYYRRLGA